MIALAAGALVLSGPWILPVMDALFAIGFVHGLARETGWTKTPDHHFASTGFGVLGIASLSAVQPTAVAFVCVAMAILFEKTVHSKSHNQ